jgi:ABC-2 type transport system permease protein
MDRAIAANPALKRQEAELQTAVGVNWFHIPIQGSFLLLLAGAALYLMSTIGVGLFISTPSRT